MSKSLNSVLKSFDLPSFRKEKKTPHNLQWLLKNIAKRNADHPNLDEAIILIKEELGYK